MKNKIIALIAIIFIGIIWLSMLCLYMDDESKSKELFKYAELLPDTKNKDMEILDQDGGEKYSFKLIDVSERYYYDYCYNLKEKGFIDVRYETNVSFGAYTDDGKYWVEAHYYNTDESSILVIVQEAKNYKELN